MAQWRPTFNPDSLYFVTTKAVLYAHLFQSNVIARLLVDYLDCLRARKQIELYAFVIMPNHIHFIIRCLLPHTLADVVRNYKSTIADRLIRHYETIGDVGALDHLAMSIKPDQKRSYQIWEEGYNAKEVFSPDFLIQKMNYIHNNPCQPHWHLVEKPEDYVWSSARFYLLGKPAIIPLDNVEVLIT